MSAQQFLFILKSLIDVNQNGDIDLQEAALASVIGVLILMLVFGAGRWAVRYTDNKSLQENDSQNHDHPLLTWLEKNNIFSREEVNNIILELKKETSCHFKSNEERIANIIDGRYRQAIFILEPYQQPNRPQEYSIHFSLNFINYVFQFPQGDSHFNQEKEAIFVLISQDDNQRSSYQQVKSNLAEDELGHQAATNLIKLYNHYNSCPPRSEVRKYLVCQESKHESSVPISQTNH